MKSKRLYALLLAVFLLAGCTGNISEPLETISTASETSLPTQETNKTTLPEVTLEAVNLLFSRVSSVAPKICVIDGRTAAFLTGSYKDKDFSNYQTNILLLDVYTDTVLAEATLEGEFELVTSYGDIIALGNEKKSRIILLDRALRQVHSFKVRTIDGILTSDRTYYYLWGSKLYSTDIASGDTQRIDMEQGMPLVELLGYDPEKNTLMCTAFVDPYADGTCPATIDLNTNRFVFLNTGFAAGALTDDGIYLQGDTERLATDVSYAVWNEGSLYTLPDFLVNNNTCSTWHIPGTNYLYRLNYDKRQMDCVAKAELFLLGEDLKVCDLPEPLNSVKAKQVLLLPDGNLLVLAVDRRSYQVYLICPDRLIFTPVVTPESDTLVFVDETVYEEYQHAAGKEEVDQQLNEVRQTADALEEAYGVTILMSNQCTAAAQSSGETITTTDRASLENEVFWIESALQDLEDALELYPEGFFRQFQNEAQERGVLILLVEDITDESNVIGICYTMGEWSIVAVDITSGEVLETYCHEFWHATEFKIIQDDPLYFENESWDAYNPEGYEYSYDTSPDYINDVENTLYNNEKNADIYFIDPYAKTNAYEDRARLMEYVMCSDYYASRIASIPALRAKLKIMSEAIETAFDTTGWDTPYWERFS